MRVILNADDFGCSRDTLRATIECFERGYVSSGSIMPNMPFTNEAVEFAKHASGVSFGVHLVFSRDDLESPLSDPATLATLTDIEGRFYDSNQVRALAMLRRLSLQQIVREMHAQIAFFFDRGLILSHVDSHGHLHKFGVFRAALERVLPKFGIRCVRGVQDIYVKRPLKSPTFWMGGWWRLSIARHFITTDHLFLPSSAHDRSWTDRLLSSMPAGEETLEVGLHPGHEESWRQEEYDAAAAFSAPLRAAGHRIIGWKDLSAAASGRLSRGAAAGSSGLTRRISG